MPDCFGTPSRLVFKFMDPRIVKKCLQALPFTFVFVMFAAHHTSHIFATSFLFCIIQRIAMNISGIAIIENFQKLF